MTKIFCDANVLIYFFSVGVPQQAKASVLLKKLIGEGSLLVVTPFVLNEIHFIFKKNAEAEKAKQVMSVILSMKGIQLLDFVFEKKDCLEVSRISEKYHLKTSDAFHVCYCKKLKIKKMATFDTDFKNIPWLTILPN